MELRSLSPKVMQEAFLVQEVRATPAPTPGGRGRLRAPGWGPACLVLSSPGRCGETSSFCLNKERGTESAQDPPRGMREAAPTHHSLGFIFLLFLSCGSLPWGL